MAALAGAGRGQGTAHLARGLAVAKAVAGPVVGLALAMAVAGLAVAAKSADSVEEGLAAPVHHLASDRLAE